MGWFHNLARRYTKKELGHPSALKYWIGKLFYGLGDTPSHGIDVTENTALTFSAYWRAINIISDIVGCLPMKVYERVKDGKEERWEHPVHQLLNFRPNPLMDARAFRKTLQAHAVGYGNGYAEIERNGRGEPIALWPMLPDRTRPKLLKDASGNQILVYETNYDGGVSTIPAEDVLHIMGLSYDGIKGLSLARYAAMSIGLGMAAERYSADFFGNDATPSGGIEVPEALDEKSVKALKDAWEANRKAFGNKHRLTVLHGGMKWQQFAIPAKDAQLIEARKLSIEDISRWTGIPPHMLGDMTASKYNNVEQLGIEFRTYSLLTWFRAWELQSTLKLFDGKGRQFVELLADAILRADTKTRYESYHIAITDGWLNRNQVRAKENLNPGPPALDEYLEPLNMVPAGTPRDDKQPAPNTPDEDDLRTALGNRWVSCVELLEQTWERILTKETRAIGTAIGKSPEALDACYDKLFSHIEAVLYPVARAVFGDAAGQRLGPLVGEYLKDHRAALAGVTAERADELTKAWMQDCPARMARLTVKGYYDGQRA